MAKLAELAESLRPFVTAQLKDIKTKVPPEEVLVEILNQTARAVYIIMDESTRFKALEMEDNEGLRKEVKYLFEFEAGPSKLGVPYVNQIKQTSCYAARDCLFKLGSTFHESTSCKLHYVCEQHKNLPCQVCEKKKQKGSAIERAKGEKSSADQTSETEKEEQNEKNVPRRKVPSSTKDEDEGRTESGSERESISASEAKKEEKGKKNLLQRDMPNPAKKGDDDRTEPESKREGRADRESSEDNNNKVIRHVAFEVQDGSCLSPNDFDFQSGYKKVPVYLIKDKNNNSVYLEEAAYVKLKTEYGMQQAEDSETEDITRTEEMNRQNTHVGS
jgi:hypothetical protein